MSLDPATEFLIRKDKAALQRRLRKGEETLSVIQARADGRVGLLAATGARILFVRKGALRSKTLQVRRDHVAGITLMGGRHPVIRVALRDGHKWSFETLHRGAGEHWLEQVQPSPKLATGKSKQVRKGGPMVFTAKAAPPTAPAPASRHPSQTSAHDPLSATKAEKLARLERLHAKGLIDKAEYRWQKDALERF